MKKRLPAVVKDWVGDFAYLFFPRCCPVCDHPLPKGEEGLCISCNLGLPRTRYHLESDNLVERLFWGKVRIERATSYFFYQKGSDYKAILHRLKYGGEKSLGVVMGRHLAAELLPDGFFEGIDVLVPIPLHPKRQADRGYNQSAALAEGIAAITHIPVDVRSMERRKRTETQTHQTPFERWENVGSVFALRCPEQFLGKHVLIVDDVLTTGATTVACALVLLEVEGVRVSVLTLAVAQQ